MSCCSLAELVIEHEGILNQLDNDYYYQSVNDKLKGAIKSLIHCLCDNNKDLNLIRKDATTLHMILKENNIKSNHLKSVEENISVLKAKLHEGASGWTKEQESARDLKLSEISLKVNTVEQGRSQIMDTNRASALLVDEFEGLQTENERVKEELVTMAESTSRAKDSIEHEKARRGQLNTEMENIKQKVVRKMSSLDEMKQLMENLSLAMREKEDKTLSLKASVTDLNEDICKLSIKIKEDSKFLADRRLKNEEAVSLNLETTTELKAEQTVHQTDKQKLAEVLKKTTILSERLTKLDINKASSERETEKLLKQSRKLDMDLKLIGNDIKVKQDKLQSLKQEHEELKRMTRTSKKSSSMMSALLTANQNTKNNIIREISLMESGIKFQKSQIDNLASDLESIERDEVEVQSKNDSSRRLYKEKEKTLSKKKKDISVVSEKCRVWEKDYDAIRGENIVLQRICLETKKEIQVLKDSFKRLFNQIASIKHDITNCDCTLMREHFEHSKINYEQHDLKVEIEDLKKKYEDLQQRSLSNESEIQNLKHLLNEADEVSSKIDVEVSSLSVEKLVYEARLAAQCDNINKLTSKVNTILQEIHSGEVKYQECVKDISSNHQRMMKNLKEKNELENLLQSKVDEKNEYLNLEKSLSKAQAKASALTLELMKPIHVHRWRKLNDSDPDGYTLLCKLHKCQEQLIVVTDNLHKKTKVLDERTGLKNELLQVHATIPDLKVRQDQLIEYRNALATKESEFKDLTLQFQVARNDVDRLKFLLQQTLKEKQKLDDFWLSKQVLNNVRQSDEEKKFD